MAAAAQYRIEHVHQRPRGWRVRSKKSGSHVVRVGFPPGPRRKGAGKVIEILHPKEEKNPSCIVSQKAKSNPEELLIFGNPSRGAGKKRRNAGTQGHKAGCPCFACKHKRGERVNPRRRRKDRKLRANRKHRANQVSETEQAVRLFEVFHGKEPQDIVDKHVSAAMRKDYTALGKLIAVLTDDCGYGEQAIANKWDQCPRIDFSEDHITLASSPNGQQLYAIGGNQNLNGCLAKFEGVDPAKDFIDLGEVAAVVYEARKIHDNFEVVEYVHKFGGNGRTRPGWFYDRLKKAIFFIGGEYTIDITAKISPGIEG